MNSNIRVGNIVKILRETKKIGDSREQVGKQGRVMAVSENKNLLIDVGSEFVLWHSPKNVGLVSNDQEEHKLSIKEHTNEAYQIRCDDEAGMNKWLKENNHLNIVNFQMSVNSDGELIMAVYKTELGKEENNA